METETHRKFKMNFAVKEKLETVSGAAKCVRTNSRILRQV